MVAREVVGRKTLYGQAAIASGRWSGEGKAGRHHTGRLASFAWLLHTYPLRCPQEGDRPLTRKA